MRYAHRLLEELQERQPWLLEQGEWLLAERGYDDTKFLTRLWDDHGIKPVIHIRNCWKDGEVTRLLPGNDNIVYDTGAPSTATAWLQATVERWLMEVLRRTGAR